MIAVKKRNSIVAKTKLNARLALPTAKAAEGWFIIGLYGVSIQFLGDDTMFFNHLKSAFFPCPIATDFSPVIDNELKFVKIQF